MYIKIKYWWEFYKTQLGKIWWSVSRYCGLPYLDHEIPPLICSLQVPHSTYFLSFFDFWSSKKVSGQFGILLYSFSISIILNFLQLMNEGCWVAGALRFLCWIFPGQNMWDWFSEIITLGSYWGSVPDVGVGSWFSFVAFSFSKLTSPST